MLAGAHPGMVADDLAGYLFARSTGHFASLMTLIARGCRRAVRTGAEKLTRDLLDQVRNDAAAEAARPRAAGRVRRREAVRPARRRQGGSPAAAAEAVFVAAIPIRLAPLPGEALDSWLEAYADLLHVTVRDIFTFAGADWGPGVNGARDSGQAVAFPVGEPDLAALSAATGVPPGRWPA